MKHFTLLAAFVVAFLGAQAQIVDPDFEAGAGGGAWAEFSLNFGTPLCDLASCGDCGGGCIPHSGDWYAWFGGVGAIEAGTLTQDIMIPSGSAAELKLWLAIPEPGPGLTADAFGVTLDGSIVFNATAADSTMYMDYTEVTIDVSSYADGSTHTLIIAGGNTTAELVNFVCDDLSLTVDGTEIVGVGELLNREIEVVVYPNPAEDQITLQFNHEVHGDAVVTIYNLNGQVVSQENLSDVFNKTYSLSTDSMENGMYLVNVEANGTSFQQRVTVAK
ncbi:MAG: T9SS type A sorting domain-containing protein [Flavobacteriales bacterium]|nr:T9SS type A sorting domain-containing protein [Flavobacteriales bacterium]